jgi:gliding motility-associated-like protein
MQRVWKASNTGSVSPVTISVDQVAVPATVKNILVSANPAFPLSGTTIYPVTLAGGKIYSAVTLNHNDYFTFSSDTIPLPQISAPDVCRNWNGLAIVLNPIPGAVYNWYNQPVGGVLVATGINIIIPLLQNDTTLYVETISAFNCTLSVRVPVTIHVKIVPAVLANITQPNCTISTGSVTIISPTGPGYLYCITGPICQPGLTFSNLTPNTYLFAAVNAMGCNSPMFFVTINAPPPVPAAPAVNTPVFICENQSATLSINSPVAGNTYNWFTSLTATIPVHTGTTFTTPVLFNATTYYAEAVNAQGCASSRTNTGVQIRTKLLPPVVTVVNVTDSSILFSWATVPGANNYSVSTDGVNYTLPSSGINGTTHLEKGLLPRTTVTLFVKATDSLITCITSSNATATGKTLSKYDDVYVPSAFTPNGNNSLLKVYGDISSYRFGIFNRFGQRVFYTTILNAGWDGTYKGKAQPTGTYVWYVFANLSDGRTVNISGTSVLIR